MKFKLAIIFITIISGVLLFSCDKEEPDQALRYFRFKSCALENHGNWQDTSFVVATANPIVIQQCLNELALPENERTLFPAGDIRSGSKGYNTNHTHHFNWHFVENSWELVEVSIEIYDGCAYSDVELTDYVGVHGRYAGWGNRIEEEIK